MIQEIPLQSNESIFISLNDEEINQIQYNKENLNGNSTPSQSNHLQRSDIQPENVHAMPTKTPIVQSEQMFYSNEGMSSNKSHGNKI